MHADTGVSVICGLPILTSLVYYCIQLAYQNGLPSFVTLIQLEPYIARTVPPCRLVYSTQQQIVFLLYAVSDHADD